MKYLNSRPTLLVCLLLALVASTGALTQFAKTGIDIDARDAKTKSDAPPARPSSDAASTSARAGKNYGRMTLSFEANRGQADARVKFLARSSHYNLFLTADEAVLTLRHAEGERATAKRTQASKSPRTETSKSRSAAQLTSQTTTQTAAQTTDTAARDGAKQSSQAARVAVLRLKMSGANASARVSGVEELASRSNYLVGSDPQRWQTGVPHYSGVRYEGVYPGVDVIYYGNRQQLEYDFHLAPDAKPERIAFSFKGAERIRLARNGDLVLRTPAGEVRQLAPVAYQEINGARVSVACRYQWRGKNEIGFALGAYDKNAPLVIDPVLSYSTYLGGNSQDEANDIAVDSQGYAYVVGTTASTNFPVSPGAYDRQLGGTVTATYDAFVTKLNPEGTAVVYSTFIGGNQGGDGATSVAINAAGEAHVAGSTWSSDYPVTPDAFQPTRRGEEEAFVTKLNADGSALLHSTYLGGSGSEYNPHIALNNAGDAYIAGRTMSQNFPIYGGPSFQRYPGGVPGECPSGPCSDGFVAQLKMQYHARPVFSTYLGGSRDDYIDGIVVRDDYDGSIYLTGRTNSEDFPVSQRPLQRTKAGVAFGYDAFVTRLDRYGDRLMYSTYLGGSLDDYASDIALDPSGVAYVTGATASTDFPVAPDAFQPTLQGSHDAFLVQLENDGNYLLYSTFIGGSLDEAGQAVALSGPEIYIAGHTASSDLPVTGNAFQSSKNGGYDAFLMRLMPGQQHVTYLTYLGGGGDDRAMSLAVAFVDNAANAFVVGNTYSSDFYVTPNALQRTRNDYPGQVEGFVSRVNMGQEGFAVQGRVRNEFGNGLADVEVSFSGSVERVVRTDNDGRYRLGGLPQGSDLTISASRDGFLFDPRNVTTENLSENITLDFTGAAPLLIKGRILNALGTPASGVPLALRGTSEGFTYSDDNGNYRFGGLTAGGSYTVQPYPDPFVAYAPESQSAANMQGDRVFDFQQSAPPKISGHIKDENGYPRAWLMVTLLDAQGMNVGYTQTDADGAYQFFPLRRGETFTVKPQENHPAWTLSPESRTFTNIQGEEVADFTSLPPYTLTGQIKDEYGTTFSGVTLTLTGDINDTVQTDYTGRYRYYPVPRGASFTVTPSLPGMPLWTFAPASASVTGAQASQNFDFTLLRPIMIDGQIINEWGYPASGVTVTLTGDSNQTVQTDSYGWYHFDPVARGGSYTATPAVPDTFWTFAPASQSVTNAQESMQRWNFNALPPLRIDGQVTNEGGGAVEGATVTLAGAVHRTTQTDANGFYYFAELQRGGAYTVTAEHELYNMTPPVQQVASLDQIQMLNFSAVHKRASIGGRVRDAGGLPLGGVTVELSVGGNFFSSSQTDPEGNYTFSNLLVARSYTVTPARAGWSFAPQSLTVPDLRADVTAADFNASRLTYTINGRVADAGGAAIAGVTLHLTGTQTATTQTDAEGNYSFAGLQSEGNYTVAPSHVYYNFAPGEQTINNLLSHRAVPDFNGTRITYLIGGRITDGAGNGMNGVGVALGGARTANTFTNASGNYTFPDLPSGYSYTVTPALAHHTFNPSSKTIDTLGANSSADFAGVLLRHSIAGRILDAGGVGIAGATVNLSGAHNASVHTDADGRYAFTSLAAGGNYNVTPFHSWYGFNPTGQTFNDLGGDQTANFDGAKHLFTIGGHVREGGAGVAGVSVTLGGAQSATAQTDASGWYTFRVPAGGNYTVAASHVSFVFAPSGATFNALSGHQTADFNAARLTYQLSGYARDACGRPIASATMSLARAGGTTATTQTDANGFYAISGVQAGYSYTLTPGKTGYTFDPPAVSYANLNSNALGNFTGTPAAATNTFNAIADAYVRGNSTSNFGTLTQLITRLASSTNNTHESYLMFDVGQQCTVANVKLRLYGRLSAGTNLSVSAYPVANTTWTETGINWNNRPPTGAPLATRVIANTTNAWYEWDITAYVRSEIDAGRTRISLALKNPAVTSNQTVFNSRQATTNQPQLVVTTP